MMTHPWEGLVNAVDIPRENVQDSNERLEFKFPPRETGQTHTFQSAFVQRTIEAHGSTNSASS